MFIYCLFMHICYMDACVYVCTLCATQQSSESAETSTLSKLFVMLGVYAQYPY